MAQTASTHIKDWSLCTTAVGLVLWHASAKCRLYSPVVSDRQLVERLAFPAAAEFVELPGVGHCPQDEAPDLVNPLIEAFVLGCSGNGQQLKQQPVSRTV